MQAAKQEPLNAVNGIAMDGFDVVAYFKQGRPNKGLAAYSVEHKGKTWNFSSPGNASDFGANPEFYAPQFNGWCAFAVSEGYAAEVDFINGWSILDGKLYLNWSKTTRDRFLGQQQVRKSLAHNNWFSVRSRLIDGSLDIHFHRSYPKTGISHPQQLDN